MVEQHPFALAVRTAAEEDLEAVVPRDAQGSAAIVAADGMLYFRYENAKVVLMEANPNGLKVAGSFMPRRR